MKLRVIKFLLNKIEDGDLRKDLSLAIEELVILMEENAKVQKFIQ